jgi:hypothetical protein
VDPNAKIAYSWYFDELPDDDTFCRILDPKEEAA